MRIVIAIVTALALSLTGACGGGSEVKTKDGNVKVSKDGDKVEVKTKDGSFTAGTGELPEGFPKDVPLVDGSILSGMRVSDTGSGEGWMVQIKYDGTPKDAIADARKKLEAVGFTSETSMDTGEMLMDMLTNQQRSVTLSAHSDGDDTLVQYMVVDATS